MPLSLASRNWRSPPLRRFRLSSRPLAFWREGERKRRRPIGCLHKCLATIRPAFPSPAPPSRPRTPDMPSPTRKEIEKLVVALRQGSWRNFEALSAADALCALLADRDRLERERDNLRALAETVCAFVDGDGYV